MFYNINAWKSDCSIVGIVFIVFIVGIGRVRSEERRVGKECDLKC